MSKARETTRLPKDAMPLDEMASFRKNTTGVDHTIFISPKGNAQHGCRIKVAIDPPDTLNPRRRGISVQVADYQVIGDTKRVSLGLLDQVRRFIDLNRDVLLEYWEYRISTGELVDRLRKI